MLDRGKYAEAADACRKALSQQAGLPIDESMEIRALMAWALLLLGKRAVAITFARMAEGHGNQTARACVIHLCSSETKGQMTNGMRWMEESLVFWNKALTADPENKDILTRRDYASERHLWFSTHRETDKYQAEARAGNEVFV